jgi:tetratricopeptide (TPR) repeat protein
MTDSANPTELLQKGQAAARVGLWDQAREYLHRAVQLSPENADAWLALAGVEDDPAEKMACFERVLELDPDNVEAHLGLEMLRPGLEEEGPAQEDAEDELEAVIAEASRRLEEAIGPPPEHEIPPDDTVLYCANHPNVETMLRCNRCGKPICTRCAVQTPVGYRCKQCVGQQQAAFYSGGVADYVIGGVIALLLGGVASFLMAMLGAWFFALILGPTVGVAIAEVVRFAVRRRRSRYLWLVVGAGIVVGSLPALLTSLLSLNLWPLFTSGLFLLLAVGAAAARLR